MAEYFYSSAPPEKLTALFGRQKAHQHMLTLAMAEHDGLPARSALRQIAELGECHRRGCG